MLRFNSFVMMVLLLATGVACQPADDSSSSQSILSPTASQRAESAPSLTPAIVTAISTTQAIALPPNTPSPIVTLADLSIIAPTPALTPTPAPTSTALMNPLKGTINAVFSQDEYLYLNVGPNLVILKLTDPSQPQVVSSVKLPIRTVSDIEIADGYAYLAADEAGLRIVDVSNPSAPTEVGSYLPPLRGLANKPLSRSGPEAPNYLYSRGARAVVVETASKAGGPVYAYVAAQGAGLRIVDVSNPAAPAEIGFYEMPGDAIGIAVANDYAYIAAFEAGLRIIDVAQPTAPVEVGSLSRDQEWFLGVVAVGHHVYTAEGFCHDLVGCPGFMKVVDISNPISPTVAWHERLGGIMTHIVEAGDYVYMIGSSLRIMDVTDPAHPAVLSRLNPDNYGFYSIAASKGYIYLAAGEAGLRIMDVSNPASPAEVNMLFGLSQ